MARVADDGDSRTVLQAHKLRTRLATAALLGGSGEQRGSAPSAANLIISIIIAAVVAGGIVIVGNIIEMIGSRV